MCTNLLAGCKSLPWSFTTARIPSEISNAGLRIVSVCIAREPIATVPSKVVNIQLVSLDARLETTASSPTRMKSQHRIVIVWWGGINRRLALIFARKLPHTYFLRHRAPVRTPLAYFIPQEPSCPYPLTFNSQICESTSHIIQYNRYAPSEVL
jgi:hypothetical protein